MRHRINSFVNSVIQYFLCFVIIISCSGQQKVKVNGLGTIDLCPDDRCVVFSHFKDDFSSIYTGNISGDSVVKILSSKKDTSYVKPKFSPSGNYVLFIAFPADRKSSNVFVADKYGKNKRQVTFQNKVITDAIFSHNEEEIYYVKSNTYEKYSPIGRAAPHDSDIYKIDLNELKETKITNLKAYAIYNPTEVLEKYFLVRLELDSKIGIYLIQKSEQNKMRPIVPANNPRGSADMYYDPCYSSKFNVIAFTAPYELYLMDLDSLIAKLVYRPRDNEISQMSNVLVFNTTDKILFKKETESDAFRIINFDGSDLQKIMIKFNHE